MEISSFIPIERGEVWCLKDVYYGNKEKGRKPIKEFINLVDSYEGVMDIAFLIEGVINARGVHTSGVFITNDNFCNYSAKMISPKGIITSQWDLHESEYAGLLKYDFLTTDACTKIRQTMDLLIKYGHIEDKGSLKKTYYHYLNPLTINYDTKEIWDTVANNSMIDIFQFDTETGQQTIKDIKPTSWLEIAQTNSLMRLQKQEGAKESPAESFVRFKNNINEWYQEMDEWGVPKEDQEILSRVLEQYKGVADTQEAIMILSQLDDFAGFTIKQSHTLRKSIAKFLASIVEIL